MKVYDNVQLTEEVEELAKRGIHKGYDGLIVDIDGDIYTVCFYNSYNFGESAYAKVNKKYLTFVCRAKERIIQEMEGFFPNEKMDFSKCLTECDVKEYDKVELLVEKSRYAFEGVHKGAHGCVLFPYAIDGKWDILFYNAGENNDEEVEITVFREDFKVIE